MKNVEFYATYDWYGNTQEKILEIKNKDLFSKFCRIYESHPDFSVCHFYFYENEIEVIKKNLEREKRELSNLPEKRKRGEISFYDFNTHKEFLEKRIKKLEELLKKYEGAEK